MLIDRSLGALTGADMGFNLAETPYGIGLPGDREREEPRVNMRQSRGRTPGREGETVREIERKDRQSRRIGGKG